MTAVLIETLIDLGVSPNLARQYAEPLAAAMALHDIHKPVHKAAFLAHAVVESARFTAMEENLRYSSPERIRQVWPSRFKTMADAEPYVRNPKALANRVYANRNGNGDEASGDGWAFRGRGIFQLTGRDNYKRASLGVGLGSVYVIRPELVSQPSDACLTAAWYWNDRACNWLIDQGDFLATVRAINGPAMLHREERLALFNEANAAIAA